MDDDSFSRLWRAAQQGRADDLASLLRSGGLATWPPLACCPADPLRVAVANGPLRVAVANGLLRVSVANGLLRVAVANDWPDAVAVLLRSKANVSDVSERVYNGGMTPLQTAAKYGSCAVMAPLVAAKADPGCVRGVACDRATNTALMTAAANGQTGSFATLLKLLQTDGRRSWELRHTGLYRRTVLHFASAGGSTKLVRLVMRLYKELSSFAEFAGSYDFDSFVDEGDVDHETPLMAAARNGRASVVAVLLRAKADASLWNETGKTALGMAVRHGHAAVAAQLRNAGKKLKLKEMQKMKR